MVEPRAGVSLGSATGAQGSNGTLADDGADLAGGGGDAVGGGAVTRREDLSGYDERGCVGTEVEEELRHDIDRQQTVLSEFVVAEAHGDEEDGEDDETAELDGLTADSIDSRNCDPVARNGTSKNDDQVADGRVVENFVGVLGVRRRVADRGQDGSVVQ